MAQLRHKKAIIVDVEHINKIELMNIYHDCTGKNRINFYIQLLHIESLQQKSNWKAIKALVKQIISDFKTHVLAKMASYVKGVNPFIKEENRVDPEEYYNYEKTQEFTDYNRALFRMLDMDDRYLSPEIAQQIRIKYNALKTLMKPELQENPSLFDDIEMTIRGNLKFNGKEYAVMHLAEFKMYQEFAKDYKEENPDSKITDGIIRNDNDFGIVSIDNEIYEKFMLLQNEQTVSETHKSTEKKEVKKEQSENVEKKFETKIEPQALDIKEGFLDAGERTVKPSEEIDVQKDIAAIAQFSPEKLSTITAKISFSKTHTIDHDGQFFGILPKAKTLKNEKSNKKVYSKNKRLLDVAIPFPSDMVQVNAGGTLSVSVPLDYEPLLYTKDLIPIYGYDENDEPILHPYDGHTSPMRGNMADIIKTMDIKGLVISEQSANETITIDGEVMHEYNDKAFKYAINDNRAVILEYTGEDRDVKVPESLTIKGTTIPVNEIKPLAFANKDVDRVNIPHTIEEVCRDAFDGCKASTIVLHEGTRTLGDGCFENMPNLTELRLPATIRSIGTNPVYGCINLKEIKTREGSDCTIADGMLIDADRIVAYPCARQDEVVEIPKGITKIDDKAFALAKNVDVIKSEDMIAEIGESAFRSCVNLKQFDYPHTANTYIRDNAFKDTAIKDFDMTNVSLESNNVFAGTEMSVEILKPEEPAPIFPEPIPEFKEPEQEDIHQTTENLGTLSNPQQQPQEQQPKKRPADIEVGLGL